MVADIAVSRYCKQPADDVTVTRVAEVPSVLMMVPSVLTIAHSVRVAEAAFFLAAFPLAFFFLAAVFLVAFFLAAMPLAFFAAFFLVAFFLVAFPLAALNLNLGTLQGAPLALPFANPT